jgi:hypothetical protein
MLENAFALYAAKLPLATRDIHDGVRSVVADAKARGVQAEHLIIEVKRACHSADSPAHQKSEVVSTLVTMCIREFYEPDTK